MSNFKKQLTWHTTYPDDFNNVFPHQKDWTLEDYRLFTDYLDNQYLIQGCCCTGCGFVWNEDMDLEDIKKEYYDENCELE